MSDRNLTTQIPSTLLPPPIRPLRLSSRRRLRNGFPLKIIPDGPTNSRVG